MGFLHSKTCNVGNNGRDLIQPSLLDTYRDRVNMKQLFMCNYTTWALSRSSNPNSYQSIYDGVRGYSGNKIGYKVEGHSNLMKHQGPESSHRDSKSN